jgi:hypothetical protein
MCLRLDVQRVELGRPQSPGPGNIRSELEPSRAYDAVQLFVKDVDELRRLGPASVRPVAADVPRPRARVRDGRRLKGTRVHGDQPLRQ